MLSIKTLAELLVVWPEAGKREVVLQPSTISSVKKKQLMTGIVKNLLRGFDEKKKAMEEIALII